MARSKSKHVRLISRRRQKWKHRRERIKARIKTKKTEKKKK
jgi:hypothetical protein